MISVPFIIVHLVPSRSFPALVFAFVSFSEGLAFICFDPIYPS